MGARIGLRVTGAQNIVVTRPRPQEENKRTRSGRARTAAVWAEQPQDHGRH